MELFSTPPDATPQERLSLYRLRGLDYGILLIPFESLSRLQQEAALRLATEWGEELANIEPARRDIQHADNPWVPLAGLWLLRLSDGPIHRSDAEYWTDAVEEWHNEKGSDPRLLAFREGWKQATHHLPPVYTSRPELRLRRLPQALGSASAKAPHVALCEKLPALQRNT